MKVSERGLAFIAAHEGFVSRGYLDPAGIVTIGYGFTMRSRVFSSWWRAHHKRSLRVGDLLPREQANKLLLTLLDEEYGPPVERALPDLTQAQFDACVSVVYNLGARSLTWKWAKALARGDVGAAAALLSKTGTTAGGRKLRGLVRRRHDEAQLLLTGDYGPANLAAQVQSPDVKLAQKQLHALGYAPGPVDGVFGPRTQRAIFAFQKDHPPLVIDGRYGPATRAALQRAAEQRTRKRAAGTVAAGSGFMAVLANWDWTSALAGAVTAFLLVILLGFLWSIRGRLFGRYCMNP